VAVPWRGNVVIVGGHMKVRCSVQPVSCSTCTWSLCPPTCLPAVPLPCPASSAILSRAFRLCSLGPAAAACAIHQSETCVPPSPPPPLLLTPPLQAKEATPEMPVRLLDSKSAAWSALACTAADGEEPPRPRGGHSVRGRCRTTAGRFLALCSCSLLWPRHLCGCTAPEAATKATAPRGCPSPPQGVLRGSQLFVFGGEDVMRRPLGQLLQLDLDTLQWSVPETTGKWLWWGACPCVGRWVQTICAAGSVAVAVAMLRTGTSQGVCVSVRLVVTYRLKAGRGQVCSRAPVTTVLGASAVGGSGGALNPVVRAHACRLLPPPPPVGTPPGPRSAHTAALYRGRYMLVFGGGSVAHCNNELHVLDLDTLEWSRLESEGPVPPPRAGAAAARRCRPACRELCPSLARPSCTTSVLEHALAAGAACCAPLKSPHTNTPPPKHTR
jgi:hypothetical protein